MTDDTIVIGYVLSGKTEHFGTLMNKYHNEIFSFVFNMLGNYDDTEDLLQEIFMKTYNKLKTYNSEKSSFRMSEDYDSKVIPFGQFTTEKITTKI